MDGFERITGREHDGLVEKCQENGWLKVGGFDWQDDPFLEEYPYECLCQAGNEQSGTRNLSSLADGLVKRSPSRASAPHPCGGSIPRTR